MRLNQAGYLPAAPKVALFAGRAEAAEFRVLDAATGKVMFVGKAAPAVTDPLSGDSVQTLDFSALRKAGTFILETGRERSAPFNIAKDAYRRAYYLAARAFYGQRCGTEVDLGAEFPGYRYAPCHQAGQYHESSGQSGPAPSVKGWHDAGDYGRYVVNSGITTGTLLWAWELYRPKASLRIPESNDRTPDLLDEIRWNLEWMLTMQASGGGVFHKQTTPRFSGFVMPAEDTMPSVVIGTGKPPYVSTCASANFAAVMAIAGRVYEAFDPRFAAKTLAAAKSASRGRKRTPMCCTQIPQGSPRGRTRPLLRRRTRWAAAELARTTGEAGYREYFAANHATQLPGLASPPSWNSVGSLGLWTYALGFPKETAVLRAQIVKAAAEIRQRVESAPYRMAMKPEDYVWGSNAVAANYGVQLLIANELDPKGGYREAAFEQLHYLLGRNAFGVSWVTHVGSRWYQRPHHRPSGADRLAEPWPGLLSGGPNRRPQDPAMKKLPPGLPPMKMWVDDQESYASNEIAINWNAPLVFLLAAAQ